VGPVIPQELLADATRCPSCSAALTPAREVCPACRLPLTGPLAARLWRVSVQAAELLGERRWLIDELRRSGAEAAETTPFEGQVQPGGTAGGVPRVPGARPAATRGPEWSRRRVQNLLLAMGVGLLGVAAIIFVAVSWDRLGVGGRSAVMAGVTGVAALAAARTHRRGLLSTAEWLSLLAVGLAVLDCYGARSSGLAGLDGVDGEAYWSGAVALVAGLTTLLAVVLPTRVLPPAAAALGQLSVPLLAAHLVPRVEHESALVAALLSAQVVATGAVLATWTSARSRDAKVVMTVGGSLVFVVAVLTSFVAAFQESGSTAIGVALLLLLAAVAAAPGTRPATDPVLVTLADTVAAVLVVVAVWAPAYRLTEDRWLPAVLAVLAIALLASALLVPAIRRTPLAVVATVAALAPALAAAEPVSRTVEGMLEPLSRPWALRAATVPLVVDRPALAVLVVTAAALGLAAWVLQVRELEGAAVPVLGLAGLVAAPALAAGYPVSLGAVLALATVLFVAGGLVVVRRPWPGWAGLATGLGLLTLGLSWSLAVDVATLWALPAGALAVLAGMVAARGRAALRSWRVGLAVLAVLLIDAESAAIIRYDGAGWAAVWSLALALLAVAGVAAGVGVAARTSAADGFWAPVQVGVLGVAAVAAVADAGAVALWRDVDVAGAGLAACGAAAALLAATAAPWRTGRPVRGALQVVAGVTAGPSLAAAAVDADRLWVALLVIGLGVGFVAATPGRHRLGWLAGVTLAASSWVRLAIADVAGPEAYTVPGGVALLVVGAMRRRGDPSYGSWKAYGSGLSLVLVPSLLRAVADSGNLRPLLLAAVAAAVLGVGAARRLQAPLLLGALVLAVDALVQLAPYLAAAYDVVPRWVTIGLLGLALLGAGATYEQRVRDLRRVGRGVARLG
jgi:hypothetical protein